MDKFKFKHIKQNFKKEYFREKCVLLFFKILLNKIITAILKKRSKI